jgi:putative transposase
MSATMDESIKRWTAKRKTALVVDIIQGKTTVAEASRAHDLSPSEIEGRVDDTNRGMENALRANPLEIREQYERQLKELQEAYGEAMLELRSGPSWSGATGMIRTLQQGLLEDGIKVPLAKLCAWFGVPGRTVYEKLTKSTPKVDTRFVEPIKAMIEREPAFGYRTVGWLLGFNKNTVQRIFQIKGWLVRKRPIGMRPRIGAVPSVATAPNERRSTDLCRVWPGRDGWTTLSLVIDCHTCELPEWHLSRSGKAMTAASALEHALISWFGTLGKVTREFLLKSDNGLVLNIRRNTALVRSCCLKQEFITPHCPQRNGMVKRVIRTIKEQYIHRQRFNSIQHATRDIGDWIGFYNTRHPQQALNMRTPAEAFALAA